MRGLLLVAVFSLTACASDGPYPKTLPQTWQNAAPSMSPSPAQPSSNQHISLARRPAHVTALWSSSPKSLFGDRRAKQLGDILTVVIEIDEEAQLQNSSATDHSGGNNLEIPSFFGLPELVTKLLPTGASLKPAIDIKGASNRAGTGSISRKEKLTLRLAVRVDDVLPNGYLRLFGRQEIIVNNEMRYLQVTGLVRTADISRLNTVTYDKIADARIFYGGRGQLSNAVQPKSGGKLINRFNPF